MPDRQPGGLTCAEIQDLAPGFVLGALEPEEMAAVRLHLGDCPEVHAEMVALGSVVPALFDSVAITDPPASLRGRILDAARLEAARGVRQASAGAAPTAPALQPGGTTTRTQPAPRPHWFGGASPRPAWMAVGLAAVLAAVVLGSWNLQLRSEVDALGAYRDGVLQVLDLASGPGGQLAVLTDPDRVTRASGIAGVGSDGRVAVVMRDLAPTSGSQVYEVWLVGADGNPLPIGDFAVGGAGTGTFSTQASGIAEGVVVALTLEPGPGATTPTKPLIALGTARPAG